MYNTIKLTCLKVLLVLVVVKSEAAKQVPPGPAKITYSPSTVIKKSSVTLTCNIESSTTLDNISYRWYRGTYLLPVNESSFTIDPVTLESRNNFSCNAFNAEGDGKADSVFLDVKAPPSFIRPLKRFLAVMYSSSNMYLTCIVECFPQCSMSWYKDGKLLDESHLYSIETQMLPASIIYNDFEMTYSKLSWHMTGSADKMNKYSTSGNYTCQASANEVGTGVSSTTEVFVRGQQADK